MRGLLITLRCSASRRLGETRVPRVSADRLTFKVITVQQKPPDTITVSGGFRVMVKGSGFRLQFLREGEQKMQRGLGFRFA